MAEKATFRLPEWELIEMRERSRRERRSLNAVVADVIAIGLGKAPATSQREAVRAALGKMIVRPATAEYDPERFPPLGPIDLDEALDWTRSDRLDWTAGDP